MSLDKPDLIARGWNALVETLGYADAMRFVMLLDKGSEDSVKYFRDLWKEKVQKKSFERWWRDDNE